ncbi:hypothetical protein KJ068_27050 [bacterium]|nr:MAG: ECF transporter S component [candidate division KSB1 bacterium]MCE7944370.1 ECF transporter S component [Chlorobi bacterium CHB1]MCL4708835.1 hypothetical protein [bacterium]MDL1878731.1 hypothetical protein [Cytophagia bacterium CHB2]NUM74277.1 hypothetical protein [candidate division KSB1 bacterium]
MLRIRQLILTAIFIALAIAGGLTLFAFPGVEVVTATVFLAGFMLGVMRGFIAGVIAEFLYTLFNPLGPAAPPLMIAQIAGMALSGLAGGFTAKSFTKRFPPIPVFTALGIFLTLFFDLATTLAFGLTIKQTFSGFLAALTIGAPIYLTHLATNTLIFSVLVPILARRLQTLPVFQALVKPQAAPRFAPAPDSKLTKPIQSQV